MIGLSTSGSISLGCALVAGKKRVPRPAAGKTALRTFIFIPTSPLAWIKRLPYDSNLHWGVGLSLQRRTVISEHRLANNLKRDCALLHKAVVKFLQRELV